MLGLKPAFAVLARSFYLLATHYSIDWQFFNLYPIAAARKQTIPNSHALPRKLTYTASALALAALLSACGGGGSASPPRQVASANLTVPITSATVAAFANIPFTFAGGLPELGLTGTTTLAFTDTSTSPAFSITTAGGTVTGVTTFGFCRFTISSVRGNLNLLPGDSIRVAPCDVRVDTAGRSSGMINGSASILVGSSGGLDRHDYTINPDGTIFSLFGTPIGNVSFSAVTGG